MAAFDKQTSTTVTLLYYRNHVSTFEWCASTNA